MIGSIEKLALHIRAGNLLMFRLGESINETEYYGEVSVIEPTMPAPKVLAF